MGFRRGQGSKGFWVEGVECFKSKLGGGGGGGVDLVSTGFF